MHQSPRATGNGYDDSESDSLLQVYYIPPLVFRISFEPFFNSCGSSAARLYWIPVVPSPVTPLVAPSQKTQ